MNKPNTNYGLRIPADDEIRNAFGSLAACVRVTGGDMATALFYLNNPELISSAASVAPQPGTYAEGLQEAARVEQAAELWKQMERPTITAVADGLGCCNALARRALVGAGLWPKVRTA